MAAASIIASVITGGSNSHQTVAEELNAYATDFVTQGIVGAFTLNTGSGGTGSFCVNQDAAPDMGVTVLLGQAYVSGTPSGQDAQVIRARMTSNYTGYTINANSSGSTKYDWIYLQLSATNANNPSAAADNVITLVTSRSSSNSSDNGSPPTYGILLAVVTVANGASSITNANITDKRQQVTIGATSNSNTTGWNTLSYALTYSANNGSKEFAATTPFDLTGILSPGMKLKVSRSVTPPTQCAAFTSASSQYATKASPSGITFTGVFSCEAWVYLLSYTGQKQGVVGRTDASTGGFGLEIDASGRVRVFYGASSSFTDFISYQSIPLNRWVHIAGVVTSVSGKTGVVYINGTAVTSFSSVTAATTLAQTSNLSAGAHGAGVANTFFNGYISESRIWSTNQTAANIQGNMAISLVGTESNLVFLGQFNGNFNDATSNANNLTAQAGAIATQANNPYNATEYATIIAVSYSNPTTTVTVDCGTQNTIPNQTLNTPYFSTSAMPFGLPANLRKYTRYVPIAANSTTTSTSAVQANGLSITLTVPSGATRLKVTAFSGGVFNATTGDSVLVSLWDGTVGSGTELVQAEVGDTGIAGGPIEVPVFVSSSVWPAAGSKTYNLGLNAITGGTATFSASTTNLAFLEVECDL